MVLKIHGNQIRKILLEVVDEFCKKGSTFATNSILPKVAEKLGIELASIESGSEDAEALLTYF